MSVVKLEKVTIDSKSVVLEVSGLDLLDKTPIVDIKPYIPYSDSINEATAGFAHEAPHSLLRISFSEESLKSLKVYQKEFPDLKNFIEEVLIQDPRPAYKKSKMDEKIYGMHLHDFNVQWKITGLEAAIVIAITEVEAIS